MRNEDGVRLAHMIEAAESAIQFVSGRSRSDLDTDRMLLFAVVRAIEIVGEAASRITHETCAAEPAIPWHAIVGMRNKLIRAAARLKLMWETWIVTRFLSPRLVN